MPVLHIIHGKLKHVNHKHMVWNKYCGCKVYGCIGWIEIAKFSLFGVKKAKLNWRSSSKIKYNILKDGDWKKGTYLGLFYLKIRGSSKPSFIHF